MRSLAKNVQTEKPAASIGAVTQMVATPKPGKRRSLLKGTLVRKECWRLSPRGWILGVFVLSGLFYFMLRNIHPFLAVTSRASGEYLVVEGWLPANALEKALGEFKNGGYVKILTTGTLARSEWAPNTVSTYADWAASKFARMGTSNDVVEAVPCFAEQKDRTYYSALALRDWLREKGKAVKSIDVVTEGPHARRTRLLFQKALGNEIRVGVISIEDRVYDPRHWWRTSEGVRDVIGETVAYIYARIFFHPSKDREQETKELSRAKL